ncbi:MAG: exodeoxyribonuclease VII small subunit [Leptolyngbyaceae cyanobacterium RM2_2_4]|nr:exodeoxyribonuclease VII small subunit [Synechococcaceae cyanobacterium SM2_3_2]NJO52352.1 exodeoxyribonuclease VII small subunit [Leptolyngbyaceae cyanobacterium RM2_2_4]NJO85592.1 exodeoxyribonuclease VII small subunit [Synechococcaceae cyanobacterium RM1_1_27]
MAKSKSAPTSPPQDPWHYEAAIAEVERIIAAVESGQLDLGDVIDHFVAATQTLKRCEAFLHDKQAQVGILVQTLQENTLTPAANVEDPDSNDEEDVAF